jgi:hypothetical protein
MTYGAGFKYVILVVSPRPTKKRPRDLAHVRFGSEHVLCTSASPHSADERVSTSALGQQRIFTIQVLTGAVGGR